MKKIRPLGDILLDIEPFLLEAVVDHDLQFSDVYGLLERYLVAHLPNHQERYTEDDTVPTLYYGHHSGLKKSKLKPVQRKKRAK